MIRLYIILGGLLIFGYVQPIIDNRYFPLFRRQTLTTIGCQSKLNAAFYFLTSDEARDFDNKRIGIPELWGKFNQVTISKSLTLIGKPDPLDPQYQTQKELIWDWEGKISGQGFHFSYERPIVCNFSVGMLWDAMHVQSRNSFLLSKTIKTDIVNISQSQIDELGRDRRQINKELGLDTGMWSKTGFSDLDIYLKYSWLREYCYKIRKIDASLNLGFLLPTATKRDINNPASMSFGGNGFTGIYFSPEVNLELKEDWIFGCSFTLLKRFPKTTFQRMPVNDEPIQYGVVTGDVRINPGFTCGLLAYVQLLDFWDAIGFRAGYHLVGHAQDRWCDMRKDKTIPVTLSEVEKHSSWISEYVCLSAVFNFCEYRQFQKIEPKLYLEADIPIHLFCARDISRTVRVSIGIEAAF